LYEAYITAMGNPSNVISQADALAAAELRVAAENARARLLSGGDIEPDAVVRLEGAALRAERRLQIRATKDATTPSLRDYLDEARS
jgi:hypothetical protein